MQNVIHIAKSVDDNSKKYKIITSERQMHVSL